MKTAVVKKLADELNNAIDIRRRLQEHDDPQLILDMIEGETDIAESICVVYETTIEDEILVEGLKAKIADLQARKSRIEHSIETRRNLILMAMDRAGLSQVKGPLATLSTRQTPGKLVITSEAEIPARFFVPQDPKLDMKAIGEAVKAGEQVPGATLSNGGIGLTIRVK